MAAGRAGGRLGGATTLLGVRRGTGRGRPRRGTRPAGGPRLRDDSARVARCNCNELARPLLPACACVDAGQHGALRCERAAYRRRQGLWAGAPPRPARFLVQRPTCRAAADAAPRARNPQLVPFGDPVRPAWKRFIRERRGSPLPEPSRRHPRRFTCGSRRAARAAVLSRAPAAAPQRLIAHRKRHPARRCRCCKRIYCGVAVMPRCDATPRAAGADARCAARRRGTAAGTRRTTTPATTRSAPRSARSRRRRSCPTATSGTRPRRCRRSCLRRRPPPAGCPSASATGPRYASVCNAASPAAAHAELAVVQAYVGEPPEELKKMDYFHEARLRARYWLHAVRARD